MLKTVFSFMLVTLFSSTLAHARIAPDADSVHPLLNGQTIPDVQLRDKSGTSVSLKKLLADKPSVIIFYRGGWCPFCNAQLSGLKEIEGKLAKLGYQILAISPDTPEKLQETAGDRELNYTLLSDRDLSASKAFGVAFYLDEKTSKAYRGKLGALLATEDGSDRVVLPVPAAYVTDQDGLIQFSYVNPSYKVRVESELLLKAAELAQK